MKFHEQKEKLIAYFDILQEQFKTIRDSKSKDELSEFDIDILQHTLKEIYNLLNTLQKTDNVIIEKDFETSKVEEALAEIEEVFIEEDTIQEDIQILADDTIEVIEEQQDKKIEDLKKTNEAVNNVLDVETQSGEKNQILYDKFKTSNTSLHDKLHNNAEDTSIGNKFESNPVKDLKKAIGINDRFTYINELFNGSKTEYEVFIEEISKFEDKDSALSFFQNTINNQQWDINKPSFKSLSSLINRFVQEK